METSSTSLTNLQIPQFNGKNYDYWAITMKALFSSQDILDLVENGFQEPAAATTYNALSQVERDLLRDNKKNDSKAPFYIFQAVHESIFPRVVAATKSKKAWDTLQLAYQGMEKVKTIKLQMLRRDIETLCMKESENVDSFFTHVIGLVTQTRSHEKQAPHWSRPSRHKFPLVKVKAEEDHMLEEEEEAHTEVEQVAFQAQVEEAAIKIQVKAQDKIKHKARGMINLKPNVITVRSMVIMKMNVERRNMTSVTNQVQI
eukprot:PITA_16759